MNSKYVLYETKPVNCKHFFPSLFALLITWMLLISLFAPFQGLAEETRVRWIGTENLNQVIEEQEPVIVDLRTPAEFSRGGIPGAINLPIEVLRADRSVLDTYKDKPLLLYCRTVNKTDLALWLLDKRGFKSIYALKGGYEAYRRR